MYRGIKRGIAVISLFFILVYPFLLLPYGLDYTDNFYYATAFTSQRTCDVMTFLFPFLGKIWLAIAPNTLVSLRIFGTLLWIAVQAIPIGIVLHTIGASRLYILVCTAFGVVIALSVPRVIGLDLVAAFWGGLLFSATVLYLKGKQYLLLSIGVLTGVYAAVRFPCSLAVFPVLCVVTWKGVSERKPLFQIVRENVLILFSSLCIYFLLYAFFGTKSAWTGFGNILTEYAKDFKALDVRYSETHSLGILFWHYIRDAVVVLKMMAIQMVLLLFWWVGTRYRRTSWPFLTVLAAGVLVYYLCQNVLATPYSWNFSLFWSSTAVLLMVWVLLLAFRRKDPTWMQMALLSLSFGLVSAVGSDTGLLKMLWAYSYTIPIAAYYLVQQVDISAKKILIALLAVLSIFSVVEYGVTGSRMQDGHWFQLSATGAHPKLKGIFTTVLRRDQVKEVSGHISRIHQTYPERRTLYYGHCSWLFHYLDNRSVPTVFSSFKMPFDGQREADKLSEYLGSASLPPFVCIVYGYAEQAFVYDSGLIGQVLQHSGYSQYARGNNYEIFAPSDLKME